MPSRMKTLLTIPSVLAWITIAASPHGAQSIYGIDGNPAGFNPIIWEFTGPPDPAFCLYPNGPIIASFPAVGSPICPGLMPFFVTTMTHADIGVDSLADVIYASDGMTIASYTPTGGFIDSFPSPLPMPLNGLGVDSFGPLIWITDGTLYGAVFPPPPPACLGPPPPFAIGPFPVPLVPGFFATPITDIEWDPATGTLWGCDMAGTVGNFVPGPIPLMGPFGFFTLAPGFCPPLMPMFEGLALDDVMAGSGTVYVTDGLGMTLAYASAPGGPAALTFYATSNCYMVPTPPLAGLGSAGRPITYGTAVAVPPPAPSMGSVGQSYGGNPAFGVTITWTPGAFALLIYGGGGPACPALPFMLPAYISPPYILLPAIVIPPGGTGALMFTYPALAPGASLDVQWVAFDPATGAIGTTEALHMETILP